MTQAVRTTRVRVGVSSGLPVVRTTGVRFAGGIAAAVRTTRVRFASRVFLISAGGDQTVEPFQLVNLAAFTLPDSTQPDSWLWTIDSVSDPAVTVTLIGTGPTVTYQAPATLHGVTITAKVYASYAGYPDVPATVVQTVNPHGRWGYDNLARVVADNDTTAT